MGKLRRGRGGRAAARVHYAGARQAAGAPCVRGRPRGAGPTATLRVAEA